MFFVLTKIFWILAQPGNLLLLLLVGGVALLWATRGRRGKGLTALATAGFGAFAVLPIGLWAVGPLEARFPQPVLPDHIDGIVLLGGAVDPSVTRAHGQVSLNDAAERVTATLALARRHPEARVLISGGSAELVPQPLAEAEATAGLLEELGLERRRMMIEGRSRDTYGNAVESEMLARHKPGETWVLVTSAAHMPRAIGCFRHVGWETIPYPVDYQTGAALTPDLFELGHNLVLFDHAMHEWVGLVAYRLLGRIDELYPGPATGAPPISATSAR